METPRAAVLSSLTGACAALAALAFSSTAHAIGPVDIEIGARVGYATSPSSCYPANPYGLGFGGRAGLSFFGIYGGISGMYYLGSSSGNVSATALMEGFEVGYTLPIPIVKIRPEVGFGNATTSGAYSASNFYLEPGVLVMIPFSILFVGADVNALILPGNSIAGVSSTDVGLSVHGQFGFRF